jgi:hypothetical protein
MIELWEQMTSEERKFRQGMRGRCSSLGRAASERKVEKNHLQRHLRLAAPATTCRT